MISPSAYTSQPEAVQGLDTPGMILERVKVHDDQDHKQTVYGLRLLVSNWLDLTTDNASALPSRGDGRYADVTNTNWEEGRHNSISTTTHVQVKSLVFGEPDLKWTDCTGDDPDITSAVRAAYYLHYWRKQRWAFLYQQKLLDILCGGAGYTQIGIRNGGLFMEWADALDVGEDTAFKEEHLKRFRWRDKHLPKEEALRLYPKLSEHLKAIDANGKGGEEIVTIRCYFSKSTAAVLYKNNIIDGPKPNPYGEIPIRKTSLLHNLSSKHPSGMVEHQVGTHRLELRLQRYFRDTVLKNIPVGFLKGTWDENTVDALMNGEEGTILRSNASGSEFGYAQGAEIQNSALQLAEMVRQWSGSESGVNDFQQGRTDTKVDFASQLSFIAQQSGVQGSFTAQCHEEGLKADARLFLKIAEKL